MKRRVSLLLVLLLLSGAFEYYGEKAAAAEAGTVIPQLAAGDYFSAGIASDGTVWSWGRGADG
ncbi:hypothetical protein K0U00_11940, partial [Paenibacillus sepulcri]|nr:hypothetical protein [Paenibacillus sepulcri]